MLAIQQRLSNPFFMMLSLPATAMGFALSVQISALSWILSTRYGLEIHEVGLVWAAGPAAGILGQLVIGVVSDRAWLLGGRRRPFILIGGVLAALMLLALPRIDLISSALGFEAILGVAIAVALTLDLAINVSFNPTRAIIADVTPPDERRTRGYTWMQTVSGSFGVLAYAIGAIWDNYVLITFSVLLVLAFSIIPTLLVEEPRELPGAGADAGETGLADIIRGLRPLWGFVIYSLYAIGLRIAGSDLWHAEVAIACVVLTLVLVGQTLMHPDDSASGTDVTGFRKVMAAHAFSWIGVQTMFVYLYAFINDRIPGLGDIALGKVQATGLLVLSAVSAALPALVLGPLSARIGRVRTHTLCLASMALAYAGAAFLTTGPLGFYVWMALIGIGWASIVSLPFAIVSGQVSGHRMGLYMGLFNLSVVLPQLVVSFGIGQLVSQVADKRLIFIVSASALLLSTLAWSRVRERGNQLSV